MKRIPFILALFAATGCHHAMEPWSTKGGKQEVEMYLRTRGLPPGSSSTYQLFVCNKETQQTLLYNASKDPADNNLLHVKLFPGVYTGFCVTNAEETAAREYSENDVPEKIYLKSQRSPKGHEEALDFQIGQSQFQVIEGKSNRAVFNLERKVGMLRLILENIPEGLDDLEAHLAHVPAKMNLLGSCGQEEYTVIKKIMPATNGSSVTELLLFPPVTPSVLTLSSPSLSFTTPERTIDSIQANKITELTVTFRNPQDLSLLDLTTHQIEWDPVILPEEGWEIDPPCQGEGNGINLVSNGGFEEGFTDSGPVGWKFANGGADKQTVEITSPVYEGSKAVRLEGKTQLYQDVAVNSGQCYQLKMFVNAPASTAKWRYWITWMKGKSELKQGGDLHPSGYRKQTDGYIDALDGIVLKAPQDATDIRMEIRNYSNLTPGEGILVDNIRVEAVD